jgi:tetratricopeptide (TPR) repeat protein
MGAGVVLIVGALVINQSGEARTTVATPAAKASRVAVARPEAAARVSAEPSAAMVDANIVAADATRVGVAAYGRGDTAAALDAFEAAATAAPDNADAQNNVGQTLVRAGRAREALPYLAKAVALRPDSWAFRFNEARAHGELKDWPRAIAGYRVAAELFPDDYVTQFNLGKALEAAGQKDEAAEVRRRYLALAPESEKP